MRPVDVSTYLNPESPIFAAIDMGSNTCRLTLSKYEDGNLTPIDTFSRVVRLGEKVTSKGTLSTQAMERASAALQVVANKIKAAKPSRIRAVATEACRKAQNSTFFQKFIYEQTGIDLEIIDAQEEARLSLMGCQPMFDADKSYVIVFDIGGGSTEIILADIQDLHDPKVLNTVSLDYGVVGLAEKYGSYCGMVFGDIEQAIVNELKDFGQELDLQALIAENKVQLIGCSGTSTTIAALHLEMKSYDRSQIDGTVVARENVNEIREELSNMTPHERSTHPCIGPGRSDLVMPGLAIFAGIYSAFPADKLLVADRGVRDGILIEFANTYQALSQSA